MNKFRVIKVLRTHEEYIVDANSPEEADFKVMIGLGGDPVKSVLDDYEVVNSKTELVLCTDVFSVGEKVNVKPKEKTIYERFTGIIQEINTEYVVVESEDGEKFSVAPEELSYNTDDIVHGNS